ncbi:MAG TPA: zinc-ribbon domain-containing protein [Candidatus Acidoferrales bacterium]|nr:zinc-ribbon domain-containing protein [Candidatus Acidoferrales bacterium]
MYRDETLSCIDCGRPFAFTTGEQQFYATKGFTNKPKRCPDCRAARKAYQQQPAGYR